MGIFLRLERAIGVVDGVNQDFSAPSAYISGTLNVFRNGQLLDRTANNGWIELAPAEGTFRMKVAPLGTNPGAPAIAGDPGDLIDIVYQDEKTGGGADGGIPTMRSALLLAPARPIARAYMPTIAASTDPNATPPPRMVGAVDVEPGTVSAKDFRPTIVKAKEVI